MEELRLEALRRTQALQEESMTLNPVESLSKGKRKRKDEEVEEEGEEEGEEEEEEEEAIESETDSSNDSEYSIDDSYTD